MQKNTKIILGLMLVLLIGIAFYVNLKKVPAEPVGQDNSPIAVENIEGCYVANIAKDVYTLNIQNQVGADVNGRLVFKNFEKDSSSGDVAGTYEDGILFGRYKFQSEGTTSDMEVAFKRTGTDFVRGYGEMVATGDNFADTSNITYDTSVVFKATSGACATSL